MSAGFWGRTCSSLNTENKELRELLKETTWSLRNCIYEIKKAKLTVSTGVDEDRAYKSEEKLREKP